jgi:MerR family transcriptional regulator, copper efflux regulator
MRGYFNTPSSAGEEREGQEGSRDERDGGEKPAPADHERTLIRRRQPSRATAPGVAAPSARLTAAEPVSQLAARLEYCEGALPHFFASRPDVARRSVSSASASAFGGGCRCWSGTAAVMQPPGIIALVHPPRHPRPAVARDPHHLALDAGVQIAAQPVVREEGVQLGQQAHRGQPTARRRSRRGRLTLAPGAGSTIVAMSKNGLFIGDVAKHSGASRKALRLYEAAGILAPPQRTAAGYRVYGADALDLLAFIRQAQRLGFTLEEIKEIVSIQRSGRLPCPHVHGLVLRKRADLDRRLADLSEMRKRLDAVLRGWRSRCGTAAVCLHIERSNGQPTRRRRMEKRVSLCPMCDHCPEVALVGDEVQIGEAGNLVVLKKAEWNVLVDAIKSGRLSKV